MVMIASDLRGLVDIERGTISREVFVNEEIYQQELELLFARAWLFVGHESQVPKPGDYFQSRMGEESVLLVRDHRGQIHVFLNTCRHRGMKVCRYDEGNSLLFTCPFHGWSYGSDGRLAGVPEFTEAYHSELDRAEWGLIEVAQLANYRGFVWATWDREAPSFEAYLGDAAFYLDHLLDGDDGRVGGLECLGVHKWRMPSNWKFPATSFNGDAAHGSITHRSTQVASYGPQEDQGRTGDRHSDRPPRERYEVTVPRLGHGGHFTLHDSDEPYVPTWPTMPLVDDYFREAHEERMKRLSGQQLVEGGCGIFPNFSTGGAARTFVVWHPNGVQATEAWRFYFVDQQAPREVRDAIRRFQMRYAGPVGMTESDDMENWNYASAASRGTIARRFPYNYQMGLGHERPAGPIPGQLSQVRSESNQRARFARWLEFMEAPSWNEIYPARG